MAEQALLSPAAAAGGSPAGLGEDAARLAGSVGALLGWSADQFWCATPAEVAAVVRALAGDAPDPPAVDAAVLARLREAYPDG